MKIKTKIMKRKEFENGLAIMMVEGKQLNIQINNSEKIEVGDIIKSNFSREYLVTDIIKSGQSRMSGKTYWVLTFNKLL